MLNGFRAAYYRTFGVPRIAGLLATTGEVARDPLRRAMDTGLLMYELIDAGTRAERGREVIRMVNRFHGPYAIDPDDMRYVLCTFIVVPLRWIDEYAWRSCTTGERDAVTRFYGEIGRLMGMPDRPRTWDEAATFLDEFEAAHVRYSAEGAALMAASEAEIAQRLPRVVRPLAGRINALLLTDQLCGAVGVASPTRVSRSVFQAVMWGHAQVARHRGPRKEPRFRPGASARGLYPSGYRLSDLGPGGGAGGGHDSGLKETRPAS